MANRYDFRVLLSVSPFVKWRGRGLKGKSDSVVKAPGAWSGNMRLRSFLDSELLRQAVSSGQAGHSPPPSRAPVASRGPCRPLAVRNLHPRKAAPELWFCGYRHSQEYPLQFISLTNSTRMPCHFAGMCV